MLRENIRQEYRKVHPDAKIPAIYDSKNDVSLFESHAILRYLHSSRDTPDHWYPSDPVQRALVDQFLDWHHMNLRKGS